MQVPMWKNLPHEIMVLLTDLGSGFIQICWGCKIEHHTDSGKCLTFQCASCTSIEDRLEELEEEHLRDIYYDDEGNIIPHSWYYSDSEYSVNNYAEFGGY